MRFNILLILLSILFLGIVLKGYINSNQLDMIYGLVGFTSGFVVLNYFSNYDK